jgi:hypothetical protein
MVRPAAIRDSRFARLRFARVAFRRGLAAFSRRRAIRGAPGEPRPAFHQQHGVGAVGRRRCAKGSASDSGRVSGIQGVAAQIARRRRRLGACAVALAASVECVVGLGLRLGLAGAERLAPSQHPLAADLDELPASVACEVPSRLVPECRQELLSRTDSPSGSSVRPASHL